jgi:hypothetical protein
MTPLTLKRWTSAMNVEAVASERIEIRDVPWKKDESRTKAHATHRPPALRTGEWTVAWERPFVREAPFGVSLVVSDGRLLSVGGERPALRDVDGKALLDPMPPLPGRGRVFADPEKDRMFVVADGITELAGGITRDLLPLPGMNTPFLAVKGDLLLTAGSRRDQHPHGGPVDKSAAIAVLDLTDPRAGPAKITVHGESDIAAAASRDTIAFVLPGEVHLLGWDLSKGRVLASTEPFTPLSVSLDDAGLVSLVAVAAGRAELWILEPDGRRRVRTPIPFELASGTPDNWRPDEALSAAAPLLATDGRIHVQMRRALNEQPGHDGALVSFSADGAFAWKRALAHTGASVLTADDRLVLTDGDRLALVEPGGQETILFRTSDGSTLISTPAILAPDAIAVASKSRLLMLRAR